MYRRKDYELAIRLMKDGLLVLDPMVIHRFAFDDYLAAYRAIEAQKGEYLKVMIQVCPWAPAGKASSPIRPYPPATNENEPGRTSAIRAIHAALDRDVAFFGTANVYGAGHGERVLGRALAGRRAGRVRRGVGQHFSNRPGGGT
jgi:hypothetical protein